MPAISGSEMAPSANSFLHSTTPSMDVSMASVSSVSSSIFDKSMIMSGSWNSDSMVNSQATYTISGTVDRGRYQLLEEIECPSELIEVDDDAPYSPLNTTSLVLEKSRIGVEHLPVVSDEQSTPLVEYPQFDDRLPDYQNLVATQMDQLIVETPSLLNRTSSTMSIDSTISETVDLPLQLELPKEESMKGHSEENNHQTMIRNDESPPGTQPEKQIDDVKKRSIKVEQTVRKERPKKPRPPSIRELQNAPIPVRQPKLKPPSKSQLMMEQLKASIEAEKHKPKKEIKSKLHELLSAPPPVKVQPTAATASNENHEEGIMPVDDIKKPAVAATNAKRRRNEPLKTVNVRSSTSQPAAGTTVRPPTKPRQSLLPPKYPKATVVANKSKVDDNTESASGSAPKVAPRCSKMKPTGRDLLPASTKLQNLRNTDEVQKLSRFVQVVRGFEALAIIVQNFSQKNEHDRKFLVRQCSKYEQRMIQMKTDYERLIDSLNSDHSVHFEKVNRSHEEEIKELRKRYDRQLDESKEETCRVLEEQRSNHDTEVERLSRSNQMQCAALDSKLAEAEKRIEELIRDKKNLEATLAKDANEKVAVLSKEISSLNTALEMKSTEMKELRHLNAKLQLKVDEIPQKDMEISKLKHRVNELKSLVDLKTSTEKVLSSKLEELQRMARNQAVMSESMIKENDMLRYRIEEMETSTLDGEHTSNTIEDRGTFDSNVQLYCSRFRQSERRPASTSLRTPRASSYFPETEHTSGDIMNRSIISLYREQGRNRQPKMSVDTIYAPEGTFVAKNRNSSRRMSYDDAHDADDEGTPRLPRTDKAPPSDCHAVTDSGISL